jgi:hypothetical protein
MHEHFHACDIIIGRFLLETAQGEGTFAVVPSTM